MKRRRHTPEQIKLREVERLQGRRSPRPRSGADHRWRKQYVRELATTRLVAPARGSRVAASCRNGKHRQHRSTQRRTSRRAAAATALRTELHAFSRGHELGVAGPGRPYARRAGAPRVRSDASVSVWGTTLGAGLPVRLEAAQHRGRINATAATLEPPCAGRACVHRCEGPSSRPTRCATGAGSPVRSGAWRTRTWSRSTAGRDEFLAVDSLLEAQVLIEDWRIEYHEAPAQPTPSAGRLRTRWTLALAKGVRSTAWWRSATSYARCQNGKRRKDCASGRRSGFSTNSYSFPVNPRSCSKKSCSAFALTHSCY